MIKYVYGTKNKKSGNFNQPVYQDFSKDNAVEAYTISAKEASSEVIKELDLYYLGTFDTKTGLMTSEIEFLLDLGSVCGNGTKEES